jgi:transcriptional regulator with XRE-family HTH domain
MPINGFKIRKLREAHNLSQEDLAFEIEATQQFISRIELNKHNLSFKTVEKLANFFQVKIDELK